jgi:hypothetical protein
VASSRTVVAAEQGALVGGCPPGKIGSVPGCWFSAEP